MKKTLGILILLLAVCVLTSLMSDRFLTPYNIENLFRRSALFGIISIGAAFVIITGGIDLSIGSVIALVGCLTPWLLVQHGWHPAAAIPAVLLLSSAIGAAHGLLITKLRLQPFIVTLCGLLIYRGVARGITADQTQGFGTRFDSLKYLAQGRPFEVPVPIVEALRTGQVSKVFDIVWIDCPMPVIILGVIAIASAVFLNFTIYGRYLLALGRSEEAARFSGINTARMTIVAYVMCATLSGVGGLLFVLDVNSAQPVDFGNFYELYAIAAAVLGGCSLRGGEGTILGVIIGAAVMQVLRNSIVLIQRIPDNIEFAIIGAVILAGVAIDELVKRGVAARRARRELMESRPET